MADRGRRIGKGKGREEARWNVGRSEVKGEKGIEVWNGGRLPSRKIASRKAMLQTWNAKRVGGRAERRARLFHVE